MFGPGKRASRIGQWDGRTRSSRSDALVLPALQEPGVWVRLGGVLVTVILATLLGFFWGPPQSYRIGERVGHDLRARVYFDLVNQAETDRNREKAIERLPPNLRTDPD